MAKSYTDLTSRVDGVEEGASFCFSVHGEKFEVSMDLRPEQRKLMAQAEREQDLDCMLRAIFGTEDLARLDELDLSLRQLLVIVDAVNEALTDATGEGLGEGSASTTSLKSTGKRSRQTSRTTSR